MVKFMLQPEHGYIPVLVVALVLVNSWASMKVSRARKKYNIQYPQVRACSHERMNGGIDHLVDRICT